MNAREKTTQQLSAYLDGELSAPEAESLARAVEADEELRRELAELAAVRDLLRGLPAEHAPEDMAGRVLAEAERSQLVGPAEPETLPTALRWVRYLATAAVLLMAVTVGTIIAVTLWSPPRPDYETHLAHLRRRGEPAGAMKETHRAGRGEEVPAAGAARYKRLGGDAVAGTEIAAADANVTGTTGGRATPAVTNGDRLERYAKSRGGVIAGKGGTGPGSGHGKEAAGEHLVKNVGNLKLALAQAAENNEIIFTDHMALTVRAVEKVLVANGIQPMVVKGAASLAQEVPAARARANVFRQSQLSARQVQYEAWVTPEQMPEVQKQIRGLRAEQRVSQALAFAPAAGTTDRSYGQTKWGFALKDEVARRLARLKKLEKTAEDLTTEAAERGGEAKAKAKPSSLQAAPTAPAEKRVPRPAAKPATKPTVKPPEAPAITKPPAERTLSQAKAIEAEGTEDTKGKKDVEREKLEETLRKSGSGVRIAKGPAPARKPGPGLAAGKEARQAEQGAQRVNGRLETRPDEAAPPAVQAKLRRSGREGQQVTTRDLASMDEREKMGRFQAASGASQPAAGGRGRRRVQPAPPATTPAEPKPGFRLDLADSVEIAARFGDKAGRKAVGVDEFAEPASRPAVLEPASGPATRAIVTTGQRRVAQKPEVTTKKEKDPLHVLQQIKLAQRVAGYYGRAEQAATQQQATARLQRLLITVNFRSPSAVDRATSAEVRAKDAAKRADPASKK